MKINRFMHGHSINAIKERSKKKQDWKFSIPNLCTDEATECISGKLAGIDTVFIQMSDIYLDGSVIFGGDQPVRSRTATEEEESNL